MLKQSFHHQEFKLKPTPRKFAENKAAFKSYQPSKILGSNFLLRIAKPVLKFMAFNMKDFCTCNVNISQFALNTDAEHGQRVLGVVFIVIRQKCFGMYADEIIETKITKHFVFSALPSKYWKTIRKINCNRRAQ